MSKINKLIAIFLCCAVFSAIACSEAGSQNPYDSAIKTARSEIWQAINTGKCGSATVAIMVDGTIVYAEGFGMADREKSIPVDTNTKFNMGSISKLYAATAIMLLVDDGKVSLDKPVTDYLPEFRMADRRYRDITVRMTLNHSSGIPGTQGSNTFGFRHNGKALQETLETLAYSHLKHNPGDMAAYCNDGFSLAEMIVEKVSGKKFIEFLSERVFKPLDLTYTGLSVGEIRDKNRAAYYNPETGKMEPFEVASILGAGGLSTTASDLCRFLDTFSSQNKLFTKTSLDEMRKEQLSKFRGKLRNSDVFCGLGWDMTEIPSYKAAGLKIMGKSGGTGNYSSMCFTVPDKRISVAVIASGDKSGAMQMAFDILNAVLIERGLMTKEKKSLSFPVKLEKIPQSLASFAGYYANEQKTCRIVFDMDKNTVTLNKLKDGKEAPELSLIFNNRYFHDGGGNQYYFTSINKQEYFVNSFKKLGIDTISMQKAEPLEKPQNLRINMDNRLWLRRNTSPSEGIGGMNTHLVKSLIYKDLPGYVNFLGTKRIESKIFAGMPFDAIRDQTELTLLDKDSETWARVSELLFSPADCAKPLKAGENIIKIDSLGYDEWLKADEDMILSFVKPEQGRIIVFSPDRTAKYDSAVDTGDVFVTKGSFVECEGYADDLFKINAITGGR